MMRRAASAGLLAMAAACGNGGNAALPTAAGASGVGATSGAPAGGAGTAASGDGSAASGGGGNANGGGAGEAGANGGEGSAGGGGGREGGGNFVVILTDDQGWNGSSLRMQAGRPDSKSDFYETPSIERLGVEGMTFSSGYAAPNCSPSRLSLLTGKTPARLKMTDIIERKAGENYVGQLLLPPGHADNPAGRIFAAPAAEQTVAELIKAHDPEYATAYFGKWHMAGGGPAQHGFDESDGPTSNNEGQVGGDDPKLTISLAKKAEAFVRRQVAGDRPFYLHVAEYAVHETSFALASTLAKYQTKAPGALHHDPLFAAMTQDLDTSIGRVLGALDDPNGDGNRDDSVRGSTYVVLLADNGAVDTISDNQPLAHGKASTWEGGIRVPFVVSGPGIAPGSRSELLVSEADILPTVADWLGGAAAADSDNLDGGSFARLARAEVASVDGRADQLVSHFPHYQVEKGSKPMSSIREGSLKLVHFYETGQSLLFDLASDLSEQHDLAAAQPEAVRDLRRKLRDYLKSVKAPMPRLNPALGAAALPDVDQDGLNDVWEFRELLTTSFSATDDPDGDGNDNATERSRETDPLP